MGPIKIFITSWNRFHFLKQVITKIHQRTKPGSFEIIVYDNASDQETKEYLRNCLEAKLVSNVIFDPENSGCLKPKIVFHDLAKQDIWYVVNDNDILPPDLSPDWLEQMVTTMESNPDVALLTPQLPPVWLQEPYERRGDIVLAKAVGNTFKMCRRSAIPIEELKLVTNRYGDDGILCEMLRKKGWKIAFASNLFCYNLERTLDQYGYTKDQLDSDPRKAGYDLDSKKYNYEPENWSTLKPPSHLIF